MLMNIGSSAIPHCSPYYALGQKMTINIILKGRCLEMFIYSKSLQETQL